MAGTGSKVFGALAMVLGIVLLAGGIAALAFATTDQAQHEDDAGPFGAGEDKDRTTQNQALASAGAAGIVGGLLLFVLGIIFVIVGAAARDKLAEPAASMRTASKDLTAVPRAPARSHSPRSVAPRGALLAGLAAFGALLGLLALVFVTNSPAPVNVTPDGAPILAEETAEASFGPLLRVEGANVMGGPGNVETTAPEGTRAVLLAVDWEPETSTQSMEVRVYQEGPDGWEELAVRVGGPGLEFDVQVVPGPLRVHVAPEDNGYTASQSFTVALTFTG